MNENETVNEMKYANKYLHTDVDPYEIVRRISSSCLEVRAMDSVETEESKKKRRESFVPGGFCGNTDNAVQEWKITSNPNNSVLRIRLHKDGCWYASGLRFGLSDKSMKFYDFNY